MNDGPLIVQSDKTLLLEIDHPTAAECRRAIAPFAELERSPEHIHTYRLTPLGLWNARAAGHDAEQVVDTLLSYSRYAVPHALLVDIAETMSRFGRLRLEKHPVHGLVLVSNDRPVLEEVLRARKIAGLLGDRLDDDTVVVHASERGNLKQALLGLATLVCDLGPTRLGVCAAERCTNVYVDTSPNQSRRYCSERCSSRANVAAYRARQKAASA